MSNWENAVSNNMFTPVCGRVYVGVSRSVHEASVFIHKKFCGLSQETLPYQSK